MRLSFLWALLCKAPLIVLATIFMGSLSFAVSFADSEGVITDRIARWWARILLMVGGVRVRVHGLESIDPRRHYVFAGNHLSLMDTPVVLANVPVRFLFMVNAKYVRLPFLGTHLRRCGHFSVEQDDVRAAMRSMTEAARTIRERRLSILLFPEGTRSRGAMTEFKEGAAYIAIKAGVDVVPFAIRGTREVLPVGSVHIRGGEVDLAFGNPIAVAGYALKDRARLTRRMFEAVAEIAARLEAEPGGCGHAAEAVKT